MVAWDLNIRILVTSVLKTLFDIVWYEKKLLKRFGVGVRIGDFVIFLRK